MGKIDHKLTQLAEIVHSFAPVVKELKSAYDAAQQQAEPDMSEGEINDEESPQHEINDAVSNALTAKSNEIDDLVQEVTENETTAAGLPDKIAVVLESILASGLNEQALNKRKEKIHRPANCKLLQITKVNSKIWDVAKKATRSMDALLQKLQEALVKGLSPTARLAGIVGESLGKPTAERIVIPPEDLWEGLSNFVLLIASANHDLNMCRRDLFKADLDAEYKAMCSNKQPVELGYLRMTWLNVLRLSKKARKLHNN